jgi:hypothetical protein
VPDGKCPVSKGWVIVGVIGEGKNSRFTTDGRQNFPAEKARAMFC